MFICHGVKDSSLLPDMVSKAACLQYQIPTSLWMKPLTQDLPVRDVIERPDSFQPEWKLIGGVHGKLGGSLDLRIEVEHVFTPKAWQFSGSREIAYKFLFDMKGQRTTNKPYCIT